MTVHTRNVVVLFSLIVSMTVGALVLMALDNHPPIKGDGLYTLTSYLRQDAQHRAGVLMEINSIIQSHQNTEEKKLEIK